MSKKDWNEIIETINLKDNNYLSNFLNSKEVFLPNKTQKNIFKNNILEDFSKEDFDKEKPQNWIPIYKESDVNDFMIKNKIWPVRSGQGKFFFYNKEIIYTINENDFEFVDLSKIKKIDSFIPETLRNNILRNENLFLNRAVAYGIINHFVEEEKIKVFKKEIINKSYKRLFYGQFGKLKTNKTIDFKTSNGFRKIEKGFQFEVDLILESENEIYIFEAKQDKINKRKTFSLLQLYYPLIYLNTFIKDKPIRTIFIDINSEEGKDSYRLLEIKFENNCFDLVKKVKAWKYTNLIDLNYF